jgi:hypothetical protein
MKKLILATFALVAGVMLAHSQGLVSFQALKGTVITNGTAVGGGIGPVNGAGQYHFELLDMTAAAWAGLSLAQQAGAENLWVNGGDIPLWTDSGISGVNGTGIAAGEVVALGGVPGTTAANWGAPTGSSFNTGSIDYYTIMGWSANLGTGWSTVSTGLEDGTLPTAMSPVYIGQTSIAYNYGGGGPDGLDVVNVWDSSAVTGLAGSGMPNGDVAGDLVLMTMPEPTTLALVGLGGLSMLFLRRRNA